MEIQDVVDTIIPCIQYSVTIAIILGLSEWLVTFFLTFALDRFKSWRG